MTTSPRRCIALFSGSLDSILAVRLVQQQGIEVLGFCFRSPFIPGSDSATTADHSPASGPHWPADAAQRLNIPLEFCSASSDYLERIRRPQFGWGRGANPCIDCRLSWLRWASARLARGEADFVITGEVLGQKAFGQKRRDLLRIGLHSGIEARLVRPLSAQHLPPTEVEQLGWLDRERLGKHAGSSRAELLREGAAAGWLDAPAGTNCCRLSEPKYAAKVRDLWQYAGQPQTWDYQLLNVGRHFRLHPTAKLVVAHNATEGEYLRAMRSAPHGRPSSLLEPVDFRGPTALLIGSPLPQLLSSAWGLIWRFSRQPQAGRGRLSLPGEPPREVPLADPGQAPWSLNTICQD